jgi:7-cyano-7-deazaguanine tRNA-ribosyltransferase
LEFEVVNKDVLGRIGRLKTKSGTIETPHLLPVVNPIIQPIPPKDIYERFRCNAIITNAYLLKRRFGEKVIEKGIHKFLDFNGVVATDSGAYQILTYGEIKAEPEEIARFEEQINSDIAVILDVPTGLKANSDYAKWTVDETLRRADSTLKIITKNDILWVGPVQGGLHLDLLAVSAREMAKRKFAIYALGSPTEIMEQYMFDKLVDMILTVKMNLPISKPLHLFGAGHPFMFSLAAALGCDLFDSASYAKYARERRYLTEHGTIKLDEISYFPCSCPVCVKHTPKEIKDLDKTEMERMLAEHNLYTCIEEIRRVKQAITEGRLWELMELRARSHPSLLKALDKLRFWADFLEKHSPATKKKGILYLGPYGLFRPEIIRYRKRIIEKYSPPNNAEILLLLPQTADKPHHKNRAVIKAVKGIWNEEKVHVSFYAVPFGVVPLEIDDMFPLSQTEAQLPPDQETLHNTITAITQYIKKHRYKTVILHFDSKIWGETLKEKCAKSCVESGKEFNISYEGEDVWSNGAIKGIKEKVKEALRRLESGEA